MVNAIVSFFVSLTVFFMTVFCPVSVKPEKSDTEFIPVLRFTVASDSHIKAIGDAQCKKVRKTIRLGYEVAAQDEKYQNLDAAIFAGDLTNDGTAAQFTGFKASVDSVIKDGTKLLAVVAQNHDGYTMGKKSLSFFSEISGLRTDYHYVINGFHFIGLSAGTIENEQYSDYQRVWLAEQLKEAAQDDPAKPIFVTHHEHVLNTVYGSSDFDGWGLDYFKDILEEYPQVVDFSGHSHYPLNDPRSVWQNEITAVGTGALTYVEFTVDDERKIHPDGNKNNAQCWLVEVDANNCVRLRGYDLTSDTWLCEYELKDVANKNARTYTQTQQIDTSTAPIFESGAAVSVKKSGIISFPAAKSTDGKIVFLYRIKCFDGEGKELSSKWILNDYWHVPSKSNFTVSGVNLAGVKTVTVTAENAYGMSSEPLTLNIK